MSAETAVEVMPVTFFESSGLHFLIYTRMKTVFREGPRWRVFATWGGATLARYVHRPERRVPRADGSIVVTPESRRVAVDGAVPVAGVGGQRRLSPRVDLRWDVQALWILPRASVGVAWGARRP